MEETLARFGQPDQDQVALWVALVDHLHADRAVVGHDALLHVGRVGRDQAVLARELHNFVLQFPALAVQPDLLRIVYLITSLRIS